MLGHTVFASPDEVLKARDGSLDERPFPLLLHALAQKERTCLLELKVRQLQKKILFEEGAPVACSSNLLHETLGKFLVERGKLTEAQYQSCLAESVQTGVTMAELVVKKQLLTPFDLYKQMQANLAHMILDCFRWGGATYRFHSDPEPAQSPIRMNPNQLILTGCNTSLPFETVASHLMFADEQRFLLRRSADLSDLKLSAKDTRFVQVLKGRPNFNEISEKSGFDTDAAMRRLYALCVMGHVDYAEEIDAQAVGTATPAAAPVPATPPPPAAQASAPQVAQAARPAPQSAVPGPPPSAAHAAQAAAAAQPQATPASSAPTASSGGMAFADDLPGEKDALFNEYLEHRKKDPFDLLGVKPDVAQPALRKAFLVRAERFSPARFRSNDLKEKAEALLLAYARAFGDLSIPEQLSLHKKRREVAAEQAKAKTGRPSTAEQFKITTELLDSESQFLEGKKFLTQGNWKNAVEYFTYAADIDPKPKYRAYLAWSHFKLNPNSHARLALVELAEVCKNDASCEQGWAFQGDVLTATGKFAEAEECYRRAFKLNPAERRYPEAIKELSKKKAR